MKQNVTAMILCLGEATRMRPLSVRYPKAFLPFCGRPLVEYTLEALAHNGIRNAVLVTGLHESKSSQLESIDKKYGIDITVVRRGLEHGSAGVVLNVANEVLPKTETILVIYGDSLISLNLRDLLNCHAFRKPVGCQITVGYHSPADLIIPGKSYTNYGILWLDSKERVLRFAEKPLVVNLNSQLANSGVFVLDQNVFDRFPKLRPLDFSKDVFEVLASEENSPIYGFDIGDGFRFDVGTIQELKNKQFDVLNGIISLDGVPWSLVRDSISLSGGMEVQGKTMIGKDCTIHENVTFAGNNIIGSKVSIGANSSLKNSIILDYSIIGDSVTLDDVVIGEACRIENKTILGEGTVIGDFSLVLANSDRARFSM